jgi:hypothetical protein
MLLLYFIRQRNYKSYRRTTIEQMQQAATARRWATGQRRKYGGNLLPCGISGESFATGFVVEIYSDVVPRKPGKIATGSTEARLTISVLIVESPSSIHLAQHGTIQSRLKTYTNNLITIDQRVLFVCGFGTSEGNYAERHH